MKKFDTGMGFTSVVTKDKLKIEISIKNLVTAFEGHPNNCEESTIKRGKRNAFAEWVAKHVIDEHNQHDGASYIAEAFDGVFDLLLEGYEYEAWNDFVKEGDLEDGE
jgi:hypothetical protein